MVKKKTTLLFFNGYHWKKFVRDKKRGEMPNGYFAEAQSKISLERIALVLSSSQ